MRTLFIGGPGRSGTSFVADRLGAHPGVAALKDVELKIFCDKNGLQDLFHALVESYSPNRAVVALEQFRRMAEALIEGRYGQPALKTVAPAELWRAGFDDFADRLLDRGHPAPQAAEAFLDAAPELMHRVALVARAGEGRIFLEKTPHNLLAIGFLARLAPGARFLHVMRDPRSIDWSLLAVRWGPKTLPATAAWVDSYCRAWSIAEARAANFGLPLIHIAIEDVAGAPEEAAACLCPALGPAPVEGLFRGADPAMLNRWAAKATANERALLDAQLGGWVWHFGYDSRQVGRRAGAEPLSEASSFPLPTPDPQDATA